MCVTEKRIASVCWVCVCYMSVVFLPSVFQLKWRGVGMIYHRPFQHLSGY